MFLKYLNSEEKSIFLKLAMSVIKSDGKLEESEKVYIDDYSREMGITEVNLDEKIEPLLLAEKIGDNSTDLIKRIFLLELTACAKADGDFADIEKSLINSFVKAFKISDTSLQKCLVLLDEYINISKRIMSFVQGGE